MQKFDLDGDGRVSRQELDAVLLNVGLNLSQHERMQFAARLDADGDGVISREELTAAFQQGDGQHSEAERRAQDLFERIRNAIMRSPHPAEVVFKGMCTVQGIMQRQDFEKFIRNFDAQLPAESIMLMWQLVDKNNDGALVYDEFARYFATLLEVKRPPSLDAIGSHEGARPAPAPRAVHQPFPPGQPPLPGQLPPHTVQPPSIVGQAQVGLPPPASLPPFAAGHPPLPTGQPPSVSQPSTPPLPHAGIPIEESRFQTMLGRIGRLLEKRGVTAAVYFQSLDVNKDGSLSADEFVNGLTSLGVGEERAELHKLFLRVPGSQSGRTPVGQVVGLVDAKAPLHRAPDTAAVLARIRDAWGRSGQSAAQVEQSYEKMCASGRPTMTRTDFEQFVKLFETALSQDAIAELWRTVAGDINAEGLAFITFCTHLCPGADWICVDDRQLAGCLYRVGRWLRTNGRTVEKAFVLFDSTRSSALSLGDFINACKTNNLQLSRVEVERLFFRYCTGSGVGTAIRRLAFRDLEAALATVPESLPEADWARKLVADIDGRARVSGASLEVAFARLNSDAIDPAVIKQEFGKHLSFDAQQWATVASFLDKQQDGMVLWRSFLGWAGIFGGGGSQVVLGQAR